MKKMIQMGALFLSLLVTQFGFSQDAAYGYANSTAPQGGNVIYDNSPGADGACPQEQATGNCWCLYVKYEPCYYCTQRCVEEQIPCTKRCCRQVPKYYEVQRCKMVPEYYTETCCKYCTEYYDVPDTKCCKKWVSDQHCKYVPKYYWKHTCGDNSGCNVPAPAGCCGPSGCSAR